MNEEFGLGFCVLGAGTLRKHLDNGNVACPQVPAHPVEEELLSQDTPGDLGAKQRWGMAQSFQAPNLPISPWDLMLWKPSNGSTSILWAAAC